MKSSVKFAPPNSVVLIEDTNGGDIPDSMTGSLIASTDSCIAVGCRMAADGETEFTLGAIHEVDPGCHPMFEGKLKTPNHKLVIRSVVGQTIVEATVPQRETVVRVWVNNQKEPDRVVVGIA